MKRTYNRNEYDKLSKEDKDKLYISIKKLYLEDKLTVEEIRISLKLTRRTVNNIIDEYNIRKSKEQISREKSEKFHKTCLDKYGETCHLKSDSMKNRIAKTNIEKYGCVNVSQNKKVREKINKTCLDRYGVTNPMKSDSVKEKSRNTCRKHYGVDYYVQTQESKDNIKKILHEKYGVNSISQLSKSKDKLQILNNKDEFTKFILSIPYKERYKSNLCELLDISISQLNTRIRNWGLNNILKFPRNSSHYENELISIIKSFGILNYKRNYRKLIRNPSTNIPLELDIYIPDLNLAIEFNGNMWHDKSNQDREKLKSRLCEEKNIKLIHIWEDDWNNYKESIIENLKHELLNYSPIESIEIEEVDNVSVYDIEVPNYSNFTLSNELVVHNSADTLQQLQQSGFNAVRTSVDKSSDPYMYFKASINERRIAMINNIPELEEEIINLERNNMTGKIDHPNAGKEGSKDLSDSICGALWNASKFEDISSLHVLEDFNTISETNALIVNTEENVMKNLTTSVLSNETNREPSLKDALKDTIQTLSKEQEENNLKLNRIKEARKNLSIEENARVKDEELESVIFNKDDNIIIW